MTYNIKGDLNAGGVISVNGKYVANRSGNNIPDSNGNLNISQEAVSMAGKINEIVIFSGTNYDTKPIQTYARIVNSNAELQDELAYSTIGGVYDITTTTTWIYSNGSWTSTAGIALGLGQMYVNTRTTKLYYVDPDLNKVEFIGTQTIGNQYANVPDMKYFDSTLSDTNGDQLLPSGLTLKWGKVVTTNGVGTLVFQKPFSTTILGGFAIDTTSNAWNNAGAIYAQVVMANSNLAQAQIQAQVAWNNAGTMNVNIIPPINDTTFMVMVWGF